MPLQCHALLCCHVFYGCVYPPASFRSLLPRLIVTYGWLTALREGATKVIDRVHITPITNAHPSAQTNAQPVQCPQSYTLYGAHFTERKTRK